MNKMQTFKEHCQLNVRERNVKEKTVPNKPEVNVKG
jgi:hypothetical protein